MAIITNTPMSLDAILETRKNNRLVSMCYLEGNLMPLNRILSNLYGVNEFSLRLNSIVYLLRTPDLDERIVLKKKVIT